MKVFFTAAIIAAVAVSSARAAPDTAAPPPASVSFRSGAMRRRLANVPCDPTRCVLASFTFGDARLECASCTPEGSKWRCPHSGGGRNRFSAAVGATFAGGFGAWSQAQCKQHKYSPSILAFSGPAEYDDYFVPACPKAEVCLCDGARDKFTKLIRPGTPNGGPPTGFSPREKSSVYWASAAPGYTLVTGFSDVSGGSAEHFDLVYTHADGRRQFCSDTALSMTFGPQQSGPHTHRPSGYTTDCAYWSASCDEGFTKTGSSSCSAGWWWPWGTKTTCAPAAGASVEATQPAEPTVAATTQPSWGPFGAWSSCSKKCGGGTQARHRVCRAGSGAALKERCHGDRHESRSCNAAACQTTTTSCAYMPSCPSGYAQTSWDWCGWGRRRKTCAQSA